MNFNELMNDDTCQILLAIIVGIVICYFIFGQKGCGNRDGFSVGGQACIGTNDVTTAMCNVWTADGQSVCVSNGCTWTPAAGTPPPPAQGTLSLIHI